MHLLDSHPVTINKICINFCKISLKSWKNYLLQKLYGKLALCSNYPICKAQASRTVMRKIPLETQWGKPNASTTTFVTSRILSIFTYFDTLITYFKEIGRLCTEMSCFIKCITNLFGN